MENGELTEMGVERFSSKLAPPVETASQAPSLTSGKKNVTFYDINNPSIKKRYYEFLNDGDWSGPVRYATIAGNRKLIDLASKDDGVVNVSEVYLDGADFNSVYHASHCSLSKYKALRENSLTACLYTTEFIKTWIIDDSVEHNGATAGDNNYVYPNPWKINKEGHDHCHFLFDINDYNKALAVRTDMYNIVPELIETKEFSIYKQKKENSHPLGYPVYSNNIWNPIKRLTLEP